MIRIHAIRLSTKSIIPARFIQQPAFILAVPRIGTFAVANELDTTVPHASVKMT